MLFEDEVRDQSLIYSSELRRMIKKGGEEGKIEPNSIYVHLKALYFK